MSWFMDGLANFFRNPGSLLREVARDVLSLDTAAIASAGGSAIADAVVSQADQMMGNFSASGTGLGLLQGAVPTSTPAPDEAAVGEADADFYFYVFVVLSILFVKFWIKLLPKGLVKIWLLYFYKFAASSEDEDYPDYELATRPPRVTTTTSPTTTTTSRFYEMMSTATFINDTGISTPPAFFFFWMGWGCGCEPIARQ